VALWDLLGKAMGQPIHRLLGTYREAVPAYASSAVLPSAAAYAEQAVEYKEQGWAAYKIHPPTQWQDDIKICEAVRKAVGDYTIMLDSTVVLRFSGSAARRPRGPGDGLFLV
jgi:L-alanine-DL-glutamate epimerase-like enolase superfamily enzyme